MANDTNSMMKGLMDFASRQKKAGATKSSGPSNVFSAEKYQRYENEYANWQQTGRNSSDYSTWGNQRDYDTWKSIRSGKVKSARVGGDIYYMDNDTYKRYNNELNTWKKTGQNSSDYGTWGTNDGYQAFRYIRDDQNGYGGLNNLKASLDDELTQAVAEKFRSQWGDKYYYDVSDPDDIVAMNAGQMPAYLRKKYTSDPIDQWLMEQGLPYGSLFNDMYSEAWGERNERNTKRQQTYEQAYNDMASYINGMNDLRKAMAGGMSFEDALATGQFDALGDYYDSSYGKTDENGTAGEKYYKSKKTKLDPIYDKAYEAILNGETPDDEFFDNFKDSAWKSYLKQKQAWNENSFQDIYDYRAVQEAQEFLDNDTNHNANFNYNNLIPVGKDAWKEAGYKVENDSAFHPIVLTNEDKSKAIVINPVRADGTLIPNDELQKYADSYFGKGLFNRGGEDPDKVIIAEFDSKREANEYAKQAESAVGVLFDAFADQIAQAGAEANQRYEESIQNLETALESGDLEQVRSALDVVGLGDYAEAELADYQGTKINEINDQIREINQQLKAAKGGEEYEALKAEKKRLVEERDNLQAQFRELNEKQLFQSLLNVDTSEIPPEYQRVIDTAFDERDAATQRIQEIDTILAGLNDRAKGNRNYVDDEIRAMGYDNVYDAIQGLTAEKNDLDFKLRSFERVATETEEDARNRAALTLDEAKAVQGVKAGLDLGVGTDQVLTAKELKGWSNKDRAEYLIFTGQDASVPMSAKKALQDLVQYATPEEIQTLNGLALQDPEQAKSYMASLEDVCKIRRVGKQADTTANFAADNPTLASVASVATNKLAGIEGPGNLIGSVLFGQNSIDAIDNAQMTRLTMGIRQKVSEDIIRANNENSIIPGKTAGEVWSYLYQIGMSMGDSLTSAPMGNLGLGLMGGSAMSQTLIDQLENGASIRQAYALAAISGTAEILTEKFSLENLVDIATGQAPISFGAWAMNTLKQSGIEASEEFASEVINMIGEALVRGDQSDLGRQISAYMAEHEGVSQKAATAAVIGQRVLEASLGGALSGGLMGGGGSAINLAVDMVKTPGGMATIKAGRQVSEALDAAGLNAESVFKIESDIMNSGLSENMVNDANMLLDTMRERPEVIATEKGQAQLRGFAEFFESMANAEKVYAAKTNKENQQIANSRESADRRLSGLYQGILDAQENAKTVYKNGDKNAYQKAMEQTADLIKGYKNKAVPQYEEEISLLDAKQEELTAKQEQHEADKQNKTADFLSDTLDKIDEASAETVQEIEQAEIEQAEIEQEAQDIYDSVVNPDNDFDITYEDLEPVDDTASEIARNTVASILNDTERAEALAKSGVNLDSARDAAESAIVQLIKDLGVKKKELTPEVTNEITGLFQDILKGDFAGRVTETIPRRIREAILNSYEVNGYDLKDAGIYTIDDFKKLKALVRKSRLRYHWKKGGVEQREVPPSMRNIARGQGIHFVNNKANTSLDQLYNDISATWPGLLPEAYSSEDQLDALINLLSRNKVTKQKFTLGEWIKSNDAISRGIDDRMVDNTISQMLGDLFVQVMPYLDERYAMEEYKNGRNAETQQIPVSAEQTTTGEEEFYSNAIGEIQVPEDERGRNVEPVGERAGAGRLQGYSEKSSYEREVQATVQRFAGEGDSREANPVKEWDKVAERVLNRVADSFNNQASERGIRARLNDGDLTEVDPTQVSSQTVYNIRAAEKITGVDETSVFNNDRLKETGLYGVTQDGRSLVANLNGDSMEIFHKVHEDFHRMDRYRDAVHRQMLEFDEDRRNSLFRSYLEAKRIPDKNATYEGHRMQEEFECDVGGAYGYFVATGGEMLGFAKIGMDEESPVHFIVELNKEITGQYERASDESSETQFSIMPEEDVDYASMSLNEMEEYYNNVSSEARTANNELQNVRIELSKIKDSDEFMERMKAVNPKDPNSIEAWKEYEQSSGLADLTNRKNELATRVNELNKRADDAYNKVGERREFVDMAALGISEPEYRRNTAIKEFGYTPYFYDAGYMLPNGKLLNFSGSKGKHYGTRGEDHRGISRIYATAEGTDAMLRFMHDGNIRVMDESPGVDISTKNEPTREQYAKIRDMARHHMDDEFFIVDFTNENGYSIGSLEYEGRIRPDRIVNDIKRYFETGEIPEQPSMFFSISPEADVEYLEAVESNDTETARKMVDDAAREAGYTIHAYHGTARSDRVGNVFDPNRATSGPMAFFTDNPDIARNYASDKRDTSLAYDEEYDSYETQFRAGKGDKTTSLIDLWYKLPLSARNRIAANAEHVYQDDEGDIVFDQSHTGANGGFDWQKREARGNIFKALCEQWLNSGQLYDDEGTYLDVLEKIGVPDELRKTGLGELVYRDPDADFSKVYDSYLKIQNPFDTSTVDEGFVQAFLDWYDEQPYGAYDRKSNNSDFWDKNNVSAEFFAERLRNDIANNTTHAWTSIPDSVTDYLKSLGHDGIKDAGGKNGGIGHTVWIPFSSEQIKSAEPITYDNDGNAIPLSERFNQRSPDIRFSVMPEVDDEYMSAVERGDTDTAQRMVDDVAKANGYVLSAYHGTGEYFNVFRRGEEGIHLGNEAQASQVAKGRFDLRSKNTDYNWADIKDRIPEMDLETRQSLVEAAYNLGYLFDGGDDIPLYDGDFLNADEIREYVDEIVSAYANEMSNHSGWKRHEDPSNPSFRIRTFDRETGRNVMRLYAKIGNPFAINGDILEWTPNGIASLLIERANGHDSIQQYFKDKPTDISGSDASFLSNDDLDALSSIANLKIKGDEAWQKLSEILSHGGYDGIQYLNQYEGDRNSYSYIALNPSDVKRADPVTYDSNGDIIPLSERFNPESDDIRYSYMPENDEDFARWSYRMQWTREQLDEQYRKMSAEKRAAVIRARQRIETRQSVVKRRENIAKNASDLRDWFNTPDVKKGKYIPDFLKDSIMTALSGIDLGSTKRPGGKMVQNWRRSMQDLANNLAQYQLHQNGDNSDARFDGIHLELPSGFVEAFQDLAASIPEDGKNYLQDMNADQLEALDKSVSILRSAVRNANRLQANARSQSVAEIGRETVKELGNQKAKKQPQNRIVKFLSDLVNVEMLDAVSYAQRLGNAGGSVINSIINGFLKGTTHVREAQEFFSDALKQEKVSKKDIHKWSNQAVNVTLESGQTIGMTQGQLMNLYALSKRPQALQHLLNGGIELANNKASKNSQNRAYKLTYKDLDNAFANLTETQKRFVDRLQTYLSETASGWGNEVSQELYGINLYGEENYWPIRSAKSGLATQDPEKVRAFNALMNAGFTKSLQKYASNPIMLDDAVQVFCDHVSQMSNYNGMAIPIADAMKWFNYQNRGEDGSVDWNSSVKRSVAETMGNGGTSYFINLIKDINGLSEGGTGTALPSAIVANTKRAAVAGKLRVMVQQPTAVVRAMSMINPKYFAGFDDAHLKQVVTEMQDNAPIAWWKSQGNFDIGTGKSMRDIISGDSSGFDSVMNATMAPAGLADDLGWSWIWNACKREQAARNPGLSGQELMDKVVERFTDVINKTQVIDTVVHRSQIMRSKDNMVKQSTAFMSEPIKTFNLLHNAVNDVMTGKPGAKLRFAKTLTAVTASWAVNAAVLALHDSLRDRDEDEDFWEMVKEKFLKEFKSNANQINAIPYLKDVYSLMQGSDVERMELSGISDLISSVQRLYKAMVKGESNYTQYGLYRDLITSAGNILGTPVTGLLNSAEVMINAAAPGTLIRRKTRGWDKAEGLIEQGIDKKQARGLMKHYQSDNTATKAFSILAYDGNKDGIPDFDEDEQNIIAEALGLSYNPEKDGSLTDYAVKAAGNYLKGKQKIMDNENSTDEEYAKAEEAYDKYSQLYDDWFEFLGL